MEATSPAVPGTRKALWAGYVLSGLSALFMLMDGVVKLFQPEPVVTSFQQLGWPVGLAVGIGLLQLACLAVYVVPRTAVLGAILLTGYLGGAVATHVRVGSEAFSLVFPVIIGTLLWGGLYCRDARLRALIPLRA